MSFFMLYKISAVLSALGTLAHTFGGMLGTAKRRGVSVPKADQVFSKMRSTRFKWREGTTSWFNMWMGNGLGVTVLMVLATVVLWVLAGLPPDIVQTLLPIVWAVFLSFLSLSLLGFKYFVPRIGLVFGLIALLTGIAAVQVSTCAGC
jgi:hypothetical protein